MNLWESLGFDVEKIYENDRFELLGLASLIRGLALEVNNPVANIMLLAFETEIDDTLERIVSELQKMDKSTKQVFLSILEKFIDENVSKMEA